MNTVTITEVSTNAVVLSSGYDRLGLSDDMLSVMLCGGLNSEARKLNRNKLYLVSVVQDDAKIIEEMCNFVSYNFLYMNAETQDLAIGDNTLLVKLLN